GIKANNEYGGTLDFGTVTVTSKGRERLLVEGTDARLQINNIEVTRNTNNINDVVTGLLLTLKNADPSTVIDITVKRDYEAIQKKLENFVTTYNEFVDYVNKNSQYDKEKKEAGPLLGDLTTRTVLERIRNVLQSTVFDSDFAYNQLVQIGIERTLEGKLTINTPKLQEAMNEDIDSFISLFAAERTSSDNDILFVYHSDKSKEGTYNVTITRTADKASVITDTREGTVNEEGIITITDNYSNNMEVEFTEEMTLSDIANKLNEEAETTYAQLLESGVALKQADGETPVTQDTAIRDIYGVELNGSNTITITGSNRLGKSYQRILSIDDTSTIQDVLNAIKSINDNNITASIDSEGHIQIEDKTTGKSKISLTIETTINGLDFGDFEVKRLGRDTVNVVASVSEDNRLVISHESYGSGNTFTINGLSGLGVEDGEYRGIDVAGMINGREGTGSGQNLTATNEDESTRGIALRVTMTPEELVEEGENQGTITLIKGLADKLHGELASMTDPVGGFLQVKIDSSKQSLDSLQLRINDANKRVELKRMGYIRKFTELERSLARLTALQQTLSTSLANLPTTSLLQTLK
ncbi:MAG TPA: flagellar filament capping protein FliD, partial [Anaerolineae bacterium]|nr:flagellar filament capping protein FliD [Anaerolineae bacterium]